MKRYFLLCCVCLTFALNADFSSLETIRLSSRARLSVLTAQPGNELYALFGHSAFRIVDPVYGLDLVADYGNMPPYDSKFFRNFLKGRLYYKLDIFSFRQMLLTYQYYERSLYEQVLDLSTKQIQEVFNVILHDAKPENIVYLYHFFDDNCATRIIDVLEDALGSTLQLKHKHFTGSTFRNEINPYLQVVPHYLYGISWLLGTSTDEDIRYKQLSFLPDHVKTILHEASVFDGSVNKPLVKEAAILFDSGREFLSNPLLSDLRFYLFLAVVYVVIQLFAAVKNKRCVPFLWIEWLLMFLLFSVGLILAFFEFFSGHSVTKGNIDLIFLFPVHFPIYVLGNFQRYRRVAELYFSGIVVFFIPGFCVYYLIYPTAALKLLPLFLVFYAISLKKSHLFHKLRKGYSLAKD